MKPDEMLLLLAMQRNTGESPRKIAHRLDIPAKRANFIFQKWTDRGWYDYGVSVDMGWLTEAGHGIKVMTHDADH